MSINRVLFSSLIRATRYSQCLNRAPNSHPRLLVQSPSCPPQQRRWKSQDTPETNSAYPEPKLYTFEDIQSLSAQPSPRRILIDVRESTELQETGHIPTARSLPINSSPEGLFLPAEEFEEKFGFPKPKHDMELVFYCRSGVRSRTAARLAVQAGWERVGEYGGSWNEWMGRGGKVER
ncbi:MAG: hypothetical protein MMC33_001478 [Icmadophila ericetorum]|nr:hypothetical protein [Icmadophila ericetorum]